MSAAERSGSVVDSAVASADPRERGRVDRENPRAEFKSPLHNDPRDDDFSWAGADAFDGWNPWHFAADFCAPEEEAA